MRSLTATIVLLALSASSAIATPRVPTAVRERVIEHARRSGAFEGLRRPTISIYRDGDHIVRAVISSLFTETYSHAAIPSVTRREMTLFADFRYSILKSGKARIRSLSSPLWPTWAKVPDSD